MSAKLFVATTGKRLTWARHQFQSDHMIVNHAL